MAAGFSRGGGWGTGSAPGRGSGAGAGESGAAGGGGEAWSPPAAGGEGTHHGNSSAGGGGAGGEGGEDAAADDAGAGLRGTGDSTGVSTGTADVGATVNELPHLGQHRQAPSARSGTFTRWAQKEQAATNGMAHPEQEGDPLHSSIVGRVRAGALPHPPRAEVADPADGV
jgi:hypothetical protein